MKTAVLAPLEASVVTNRQGYVLPVLFLWLFERDLYNIGYDAYHDITSQNELMFGQFIFNDTGR